LHAVALAHVRLLGQGPAAPPALQVPAPSHDPPGVNVEPEHDGLAPHAVPLDGKSHAPVPLHPVAPHAPPTGEQAAVQHAPVPPTPQTPLVHWSFAAHVAPAEPFATQAPAAQ
jgi:hypothetical protein